MEEGARHGSDRYTSERPCRADSRRRRGRAEEVGSVGNIGCTVGEADIGRSLVVEEDTVHNLVAEEDTAHTLVEEGRDCGLEADTGRNPEEDHDEEDHDEEDHGEEGHGEEDHGEGVRSYHLLLHQVRSLDRETRTTCSDGPRKTLTNVERTLI